MLFMGFKMIQSACRKPQDAMTLSKQLKLEQKAAAEQAQIIFDLEKLVSDIERADRTITALNVELQGVNSKYEGRRTTQEDIQYLTALLKCANKKLVWEKQMGSLQKRIPAILETVSNVVNNPNTPADHDKRAQILETLQRVQSAMERLQSVKEN